MSHSNNLQFEVQTKKKEVVAIFFKKERKKWDYSFALTPTTPHHSLPPIPMPLVLFAPVSGTVRLRGDGDASINISNPEEREPPQTIA